MTRAELIAAAKELARQDSKMGYAPLSEKQRRHLSRFQPQSKQQEVKGRIGHVWQHAIKVTVTCP
jgi:hypothetical protein